MCDRVFQIRFLFALLCAYFCVQNSYANQEYPELTTLLKHKIEQENLAVGISVAVIDGEQTHFINLGTSDKKQQQAITQNTLFEIGSISKTFTSTLLANMVYQGEVNLEDNINQLLPESVHIKTSNPQPITLLSLANHSSGLAFQPNNLLVNNPANPYQGYRNQELINYLTNLIVKRKAGEKIEYSNLGIGLLAFALSHQQNQSLESLIYQRILSRLDMENTYITVPVTKTNKLSQGHDFLLKPVPALSANNALAGAVSYKSNTRDMAKFLRANMYLNALTQTLYLTQIPTINYGDKNQIGLGWFITPHQNHTLYSHRGSTGGFRSFIGFVPGLQKGIVILSNSFYDVSEIGFSFLTNQLESLRNRQITATLSRQQFAKVTGSYLLNSGHNLTVYHQQNLLIVETDNQPALPFFSITEKQFYNPMLKTKLVFEITNNSQAKYLTLYQGKYIITGVKQN